jgi:FkbM family methyltransferase
VRGREFASEPFGWKWGMNIVSKVRTASRLASSGDLGSFWRLAKNNVLSWVSDTRTVRIGSVRFRMYATASDDLFLVGDEREHRLLELVSGTRLRCVFDIGAHLGLHTLFYSAMADKVVSFEPAPRNYARLVDNIGLNGRTNVSTWNVALSDRSTMLDFMDNGISQTGTLLTNAQHAHGFRKIQVQAYRLDDLDLPAPDLIKIDCEGAEMQVLRGAAETLRRHRPVLHLEVHPLLGVSEARLQEFLHSAGYTVQSTQKGAEMHYLCDPC